MECEAATALGSAVAAPHQLACSLTMPGIEAASVCGWERVRPALILDVARAPITCA